MIVNGGDCLVGPDSGWSWGFSDNGGVSGDCMMGLWLIGNVSF